MVTEINFFDEYGTSSNTLSNNKCYKLTQLLFGYIIITMCVCA